jgi:hypothetical protein
LLWIPRGLPGAIAKPWRERAADLRLRRRRRSCTSIPCGIAATHDAVFVTIGDSWPAPTASSVGCSADIRMLNDALPFGVDSEESAGEGDDPDVAVSDGDGERTRTVPGLQPTPRPRHWQALVGAAEA